MCTCCTHACLLCSACVGRSVTFETRVDAVDKSQASEIQTEADTSNVSERPHSDKRRLHVCTVCDKRFVQKGSLNEHRKRHSGEHVYLCSECEKRFSSRTQLMQHMNIHTDKYKCTECGQCCQCSRHLAVHRRSHSGEQPFECTVCSKRFTQSGNLVCHNRIHSTVERNRTTVTCVTRRLVSLDI